MNKSTQPTTAIEMNGVSFAYGPHPTLTDINLNIEHGDFVGILGPNGGGKTTLLKLILGLLEPKTGSIKLFDEDVKSSWKKGLIGYVPQRVHTNLPGIPVSCQEVIEMTGVNKQVALEALEKVEMKSFAETPISEISGGQAQRVFIARALATKPRILLLDEPTSGVDQEAQTSFYELLQKLNKEGVTMLMVSHDVDTVSREVKTIFCVNQKIVCHGDTKKVLKNNDFEKLYDTPTKRVVHTHS